MPVESSADMAVFLSVDDFGDEGTYSTKQGQTKTFAGLLDRPTVDADVSGDGPDVLDRRPTFLCREQDLPAGAESGDAGDTLVAKGTTFSVIDIKPDGSGFVLLTLGKLTA